MSDGEAIRGPKAWEQKQLKRLREIRQKPERRIGKRLRKPDRQVALAATREYAVWYLLGCGRFRKQDVGDLVNALMERVEASAAVLELLRFDTPPEEVAQVLEAIVHAYGLKLTPVTVEEQDLHTNIPTTEIQARLERCREMSVDVRTATWSPQDHQALHDGLRSFETELEILLDLRQLDEGRRALSPQRPRTPRRLIADAVDAAYCEEDQKKERNRLAATLVRDVLREEDVTDKQIATLQKDPRRAQRRRGELTAQRA